MLGGLFVYIYLLNGLAIKNCNKKMNNDLNNMPRQLNSEK